jgi:uncharacterized protein (TIGR02757 family)
LNVELFKIKELLDKESQKRDSINELSLERPDPLIVAKKWNDERVALISALFAYGKASLILKFLESLDFDLLNDNEVKIEKLRSKVYRFQTGNDIEALFIALNRIYKNGETLETIFKNGYLKNRSVLDGISQIINRIKTINPYFSNGYKFLIGDAPTGKLIGESPLKRWNLYIRWMVRRDNLDMGLWSDISRSDLLIPLDTHTFHISQKLNLLQRKTYDLKAVFNLTNKLKEFDSEDPVKYDFALYRIGQEGLI